MLAQPLSEHDQGGRGLTCAILSPGLPLDNDVSISPTGVSYPSPSPLSSASPPSFFPSSSTSPVCPPCSLLFPIPVPPSVLPLPPPPPLSVPSYTPFVAPSPLVSSSSHSPSPPPSHFLPSSVLLSPFLHSSPPTSVSLPSLDPILLSSTPPPHSSSSPLLPLSLHPLLPTVSPSILSSSSPLLTPPQVTSASLTPPFHSPPPPASSVSSPSSPPSPFSSSLPPTSVLSPISQAPHPPPPTPVSCSCSSLLPRLLSAHRLEVRRLLRGALSSLGRRLDSLERRTRRKSRSRRGEGLAAFKSSCSSTPTPTLASSSLSSSSDNKDTSRFPFSPSFSQSEKRSISRGQEDVRMRKRRRKDYTDEGGEEEGAGSSVGQMMMSYIGGRGGAQEEVLLTLHDFNHRRRDQEIISQSQKAVTVLRHNGYSLSDPSSQHTLHFLQSAQSSQTSRKSEALKFSFSQWSFSEFTPPDSLSFNHTFSRRWLCSSPSSSARMLLLSKISISTLSQLLWSGEHPLWSLKDMTAPPSLSSDHCYVRSCTSSLICSARRQQKQRANHITRSVHLAQRRPLSLPPCSANGLCNPFPLDQSASSPRFLSTNGECSKRVSQIRIRRTTPRETPLTPMGLPKVKRLKKKEFSLEEIYTNKNYKSPSTNRSLETIFEEPREKDGALLLVGQQRRRRLLLFPDFTQPRKRKRQQVSGLPVSMVHRKRAVRRNCHGDGSGDDIIDLDVMLVERLSALEDFMTRQGIDI